MDVPRRHLSVVLIQRESGDLRVGEKRRHMLLTKPPTPLQAIDAFQEVLRDGRSNALSSLHQPPVLHPAIYLEH